MHGVAGARAWRCERHRGRRAIAGGRTPAPPRPRGWRCRRARSARPRSIATVAAVADRDHPFDRFARRLLSLVWIRSSIARARTVDPGPVGPRPGSAARHEAIAYVPEVVIRPGSSARCRGSGGGVARARIANFNAPAGDGRSVPNTKRLDAQRLPPGGEIGRILAEPAMWQDMSRRSASSAALVERGGSGRSRHRPEADTAAHRRLASCSSVCVEVAVSRLNFAELLHDPGFVDGRRGLHDRWTLLEVFIREARDRGAHPRHAIRPGSGRTGPTHRRRTRSARSAHRAFPRCCSSRAYSSRGTRG